MDFHARHKLLLMSHSPALLRQMGALVAHADRRRQDELLETYERLMMKALSLPATRPKHANVLQHMMGYVKKTLSADEKREMLDVIDRYRKRLLPLIVPVTLIRHYVRKYDVAYLREQCYLDPHPMELRLRNHA